ncbi:MAG: MBL fold metallo-hydrolase [Candidatus Eremiobacteraeota bacterium]|nr:MBL fold metallo-hydrolase [Candidatus Eremiobacteraeota bacterium]
MQIRLPMAGNPMRHINGYLVREDDGFTLIDCGWKTDDVLAALHAGLAEAGETLAAVKRIVVTHMHFDHYGLAGTLLRAGVPDLLLHAKDWEFASRILADPLEADRISDLWLGRNGFPVEPSDEEAEHHRLNELTEPTRIVADGERIGRLLVVWTPGHTPGHICLVDTQSGRMFTGDHVLDPVTPHVGFWAEHRGDPLGDYIASLKRVGSIGASGVLPAHGEPFPDLQRRVDELLAHEATREDQIVDVLHAGPASAAGVAERLPWTRRNKPFADLGEFHQQFAVAETLAHLEHLRAESRAGRHDDGGYRYTLTA